MTLKPILSAAFRAFFPRRYYATTKQEREAIAATARKWRSLAVVCLVIVPPLAVAVARVLTRSVQWMPKELS